MRNNLRRGRWHSGLLALLCLGTAFVGAQISAGPAAALSAEQIVNDCLNAKSIYYPDPPADPNAPDYFPDCKLTYKSSEQVYSEQTLGDALGGDKPRPLFRACGDSPGNVQVGGTKSSSFSFSFGLDAGAKKKFGDWEGSVGPKLGVGWSWSDSSTYTNGAVVPSSGVGWVAVRKPQLKVVVDVKAVYSSSNTQYASNVTAYVPDKSRPWDWQAGSRPMSDWELNHYCGSGGTPGSDSSANYTESTSARVAYGDFRLWLPSQYRWFNAATSKCAAPKDASTANDARAVQIACDVTTPAQQRWSRTKQPDGSFLIKNDKSGKCLDVSGDKVSNWVDLLQYTCTPAVAWQNWAIMRATVKIAPNWDEQPAYYLYNRHSGKCAAIDSGALLSNNAPLQQYDCQSLPRPKTFGSYDVWAAGSNAPYKNLTSGKCLDIGGTVPGGGLVVQRNCNGKASQKWNAVQRAGNWHNIKNSNGNCLTVPYNNGTAPGENTQLMWWPCETRWESGNQNWSINPRATSGTYQFGNQWTGLCLAPHPSDVTKDGGRVALRKCL
ncbi:hypothetical protein GCM10027589_06830 [Actinocorallia lasiicapitis]